MPNPIDITGKKYGRLTAIRLLESRKVGTQSKRFWLFSCECGKEMELAAGAVTSGNTLSCGCLLKDTITKHGGTGTKVYGVWHAMINRCRDRNDPAYKDYGGRGIIICERWMEFANFAADMGPRPEGGTLDRIDVNGNYEPGNCRWADAKKQANNRRNNMRLMFNGEDLTMSEWADRLGVSKSRIKNRIDAGWTIEATLTEPFLRGRRKYVNSRGPLHP
jgi:hypothetical protein